MTRTPTTSVTAMAIAARAFAWDIPSGAPFSVTRHSHSRRGTKMPLLHSLSI
jgi:hypothetical protein